MKYFYQGGMSDNSHEFVEIDVSPFRQIGIEYQEENDYTPALGDELNMQLLDLFETAMDSTFIAAIDSDCSPFYYSTKSALSKYRVSPPAVVTIYSSLRIFLLFLTNALKG